jgi:hypothetical protein
MRRLEFWNGGFMESGRSSLCPSIPSFHYSNILVSEQRHWLLSRRADFWLACGGASLGLLAAILVIFCHGDRELDALDFVLSEFHLGATYGAVFRRRLWRHRQVDVVLVPLFILALTYAFSIGGQTILLTSIAMYAAVWHRGRQSFGVARFYQRQAGGPVSRLHDVLFRGAIYLPMLAGMLAYTHLAPTDYEGKPYFALNFSAEITSLVGFAALIWVIAYLVFTLWRDGIVRLTSRRLLKNSLGVLRQAQDERRELRKESENSVHAEPVEAFLGYFQQSTRWRNMGSRVHPGECWVVLAHAIAFGSSYALGASNASFLLVLAVHHEVQYLYFTYAMARRSESFRALSNADFDQAKKAFDSRLSFKARRVLPTELKQAASFLVWPVIGFVGALVGGWSELEWLAPLGMGGLFCHYWLDGRIWTRKSFQN